MSGAESSAAAPVRSRRVFYIPGYDPFPPRRYRELYRTEARLQCHISGHEIRLEAAPGAESYGFRLGARVQGRDVAAAVEILGWSDIVQASMGQGIWATYRQLFSTAWAYIGTGALFRLIRLRKGPMIAALYPILLLLGQLAVALIMGWMMGRFALVAFDGSAWPLTQALSLALSLGTATLVLTLFRHFDRRVYAWYLMHDYAFTTIEGGAYPLRLQARLAAFRARIAAAMDEDWDEVLVVGHSSGAHLAISVLADLIRDGRAEPGPGPALSLLTLGHVVPMVSYLRGATRLRDDLAYLSERPELTWVDVTAPGDGCSFALCDPVSVSGMAGPGKRWPLVISAAFSQTLSPERWQALRRRYFRLHFQYLCAFDRPGIYDYFAITAGPQTLAARFAGRAPSKSRVLMPLNPFGRVQP